MDCLFCKIVSGEIPSERIFENETVYAFRDIQPAAPEHILVIPKKHIAKISDIEESDKGLMGDIHLAIHEVCERLKFKDYRLIVNNGKGAGQTVFHLHFHILSGRSFSWPPG